MELLRKNPDEMRGVLRGLHIAVSAQEYDYFINKIFPLFPISFIAGQRDEDMKGKKWPTVNELVKPHIKKIVAILDRL